MISYFTFHVCLTSACPGTSYSLYEFIILTLSLRSFASYCWILLNFIVMYIFCIVIPNMSLRIIYNLYGSDILLVKRWSLLSVRHPARVALHVHCPVFICRLVCCAEGSNEALPSFPTSHTRISFRVWLTRDFLQLPQVESELASRLHTLTIMFHLLVTPELKPFIVIHL